MFNDKFNLHAVIEDRTSLETAIGVETSLVKRSGTRLPKFAASVMKIRKAKRQRGEVWTH